MVVADSVSVWWIVGWGIGFGGAVVAAILLLLVIRTGRTIASQADEIRDSIDSAHRNTQAMFDLPRLNLALDRIVRHLQALRGGRAR